MTSSRPPKNPKEVADHPPTEKRRRSGLRGELDDLRAGGGFRAGIRRFLRESPAFAFSGGVHLLMVLVLALVTLAPDRRQVVESLLGTASAPSDEPSPAEVVLEAAAVQPPPEDASELPEAVADSPFASPDPDADHENAFDDAPAAPLAVPQEATVGVELPAHIGDPRGKTMGKGFEGRGTAAARKRLVASACGTETSEQAVQLALNWLAQHQLASGAWSCDHGRSPTHVGPVRDPGRHEPECGSTGLALLVFLGAGQTHREGMYQEEVRRGLHFLGREMKVTRSGGDLRGGGTLYDHAIATIALCEAYALSQDPTLAAPAQAALDFIHSSQDKTGGGWRYRPGQAGDTSVVGWQVQALKSGHLAELRVERRAVQGAATFLDAVQTDGGASYGYISAGKAAPLSAVGILCRMYLGWKKDEPALQRGVEYLSKLGPQKNNMYHNYYATQVMRHYGGDVWKKWNSVMRDQLVSTQEVHGGHQEEKGSWKPSASNHSTEQGGRLVETCFAAMTLEVYYRHLPLYQDAAGDSEF